MDDVKYKLLQYSTMGWEEVHTNLTKQECTIIIENNLAEGINPNHMKVELDNSTN